MQPNMKKMIENNTSVLPSQTTKSVIDRLLQRRAHHIKRSRLACPNLERFGALMEEHAEAVGGFAAGFGGSGE